MQIAWSLLIDEGHDGIDKTSPEIVSALHNASENISFGIFHILFFGENKLHIKSQV